MITKKPAKTWIFASESNPTKKYETLQYTDGSTSCNCPGWCRRVAKDGSRSCKHVRAVALGIADVEAVTHTNLTGENIPTLAKAAKVTEKTVTTATTAPRLYNRKFKLEL